MQLLIRLFDLKIFILCHKNHTQIKQRNHQRDFQTVGSISSSFGSWAIYIDLQCKWLLFLFIIISFDHPKKSVSLIILKASSTARNKKTWDFVSLFKSIIAFFSHCSNYMPMPSGQRKTFNWGQFQRTVFQWKIKRVLAAS